MGRRRQIRFLFLGNFQIETNRKLRNEKRNKTRISVGRSWSWRWQMFAINDDYVSHCFLHANATTFYGVEYD